MFHLLNAYGDDDIKIHMSIYIASSNVEESISLALFDSTHLLVIDAQVDVQLQLNLALIRISLMIGKIAYYSYVIMTTNIYSFVKWHKSYAFFHYIACLLLIYKCTLYSLNYLFKKIQVQQDRSD